MRQVENHWPQDAQCLLNFRRTIPPTHSATGIPGDTLRSLQIFTKQQMEVPTWPLPLYPMRLFSGVVKSKYPLRVFTLTVLFDISTDIQHWVYGHRWRQHVNSQTQLDPFRYT